MACLLYTSGIAPANLFPMWDWVGGRYSMDSAIGLSTMIAIGDAHFRELLHGMRAMDEHFCTAALANNMPALLGLLSIWNNNFLGCTTLAVLPYDQYLKPVSYTHLSHCCPHRRMRILAAVFPYPPHVSLDVSGTGV